MEGFRTKHTETARVSSANDFFQPSLIYCYEYTARMDVSKVLPQHSLLWIHSQDGRQQSAASAFIAMNTQPGWTCSKVLPQHSLLWIHSQDGRQQSTASAFIAMNTQPGWTCSKVLPQHSLLWIHSQDGRQQSTASAFIAINTQPGWTCSKVLPQHSLLWIHNQDGRQQSAASAFIAINTQPGWMSAKCCLSIHCYQYIARMDVSKVLPQHSLLWIHSQDGRQQSAASAFIAINTQPGWMSAKCCLTIHLSLLSLNFFLSFLHLFSAYTFRDSHSSGWLVTREFSSAATHTSLQQAHISSGIATQGHSSNSSTHLLLCCSHMGTKQEQQLWYMVVIHLRYAAMEAESALGEHSEEYRPLTHPLYGSNEHNIPDGHLKDNSETLHHITLEATDLGDHEGPNSPGRKAE